MNDELYLIYIHEIGPDHRYKNIYEFIFSDTKEEIDGEGWDAYPASGNPEVPKEELKKAVGKMSTDLKLNVAQKNEQFSMWDAIDGVLPLGWENIDGMEEYPDNRLVFPFGITKEEVDKILYTRDLIIKYDKQYEDND
tara:strand:+ start:8501 stop:8914 length:414 start_codon:yes stop_codon:yes gene_type:complete